MSNDNHQTIDAEEYDSLRKALTESFAPILKVYGELVRRASPVNVTHVYSVKKLAQTLECDFDMLMSILTCMADLGFIEICAERQHRPGLTITLLAADTDLCNLPFN